MGFSFTPTTKPYLEDCTDINTFIWRIFVSYQPLNSITRSFEYLIPRYTDSIEGLKDSCSYVSMILFDDRSEYHQASVRSCD